MVCPNRINAFSLASKKRFSHYTFSSNDNDLCFENSGEVCEKVTEKIKSLKEISFMIFIILSNVLTYFVKLYNTFVFIAPYSIAHIYK